jgi:hypothetical protein
LGSTIAVNGVADSETVTRLQGLLMSGRPVAGAWGAPYQVPAPGQGPFGVPTMTAYPGAPRSPDGQGGWDGTQWRPTSPSGPQNLTPPGPAGRSDPPSSEAGTY